MFNKVMLIGNLTKDIEFKYLSNNTALAKSSIATSYKYKSANNEQKEEVCFLDFDIFGKTAEIANQYLHKGSKVLLEGRLILDTWIGTDGQKRTKHSLRVETMKMLGGSNNNNEISNRQETSITKTTVVDDLDEVPDDWIF